MKVTINQKIKSKAFPSLRGVASQRRTDFNFTYLSLQLTFGRFEIGNLKIVSAQWPVLVTSDGITDKQNPN